MDVSLNFFGNITCRGVVRDGSARIFIRSSSEPNNVRLGSAIVADGRFELLYAM